MLKLLLVRAQKENKGKGILTISWQAGSLAELYSTRLYEKRTCLAEISKQNVESSAWFLLVVCSKMSEMR